MHRTIAVLGLGQMGLSALDLLLEQLTGAQFLCVDRSEQAVNTAVGKAPDRVRGIAIDVTSGDLDFSGVDVVLNLTGPFFAGSDHAARAAIEHGAAYIDISDDVEGTRTVLDLAPVAEAAGVPVITGAGFSPGITNWVACELLDQHPNADGIQIAWVVHEADPGGLAPLRHMLHLAVSPCPLLVDGKWQESPGFVPQTAKCFDFPDPIGRVETFDTAHPEPLTLARQFPRLKYASCKGALHPAWANGAFSTLGRIGFGYLDNHVQMDGLDIDPTEVLWRMMWRRHDRRGRAGGNSYTAAQVLALEGDDVVAGWGVHDNAVMSRATGLGAVIATEVLLQYGAPPGAHGPEGLRSDAAVAMFTQLAQDTGSFPGGLLPIPVAAIP